MSPFDVVAAKLSTGGDALIQVCGDSTAQGLRTVSTPDPNHGWVGRLGIDIGVGYDVNVRYRGAAYPGSATWPGYNQDEITNASSHDAAPTLTIYNGSIGGAQATHLINWINAAGLIPDPNPDVVLVACGFNDVNNGANLLSRTQSLVNTIRARCPTAPIVVTTENRSTGTYPTSRFLSSFSAMSNHYVGHALNLDPALQESNVVDGVWVMDTQQAYTVIPLTDWMTTNDTVGGLHPNSVGYQAQADWMYGLFPPPIDPVPVIITDSLSSLTRGVAFSQVIMSSSVGIWSVVDGVLPSGLSLNSTTGEISGTPLAYGGNYDFTIRVTNDAGHDQRRFTGIIDSSTMPFDPKGLAKTKWRMLEHYYFIAAKIRTGGEFKHLTPRD